MDKKLLLRGSAFSLFSFFAQGVNFLLLLLLANYLVPSDYGSLSLFTTITTFLGYIIALSSQGYVSISYFKENRQMFSEDVSSIFYISIVVYLFFSVLLFIFPKQLSYALQVETQFLWLSLIISLCSLIYCVTLDIFRVREKIYSYGLLSCSFALINFLLTIFFVIFRDLNWQGRVYSQFSTYLLFALIGLIVLLKQQLIFKSINIERIKEILIWGLPLVPHSISNWIKQGCDRYIINFSFSLDEVGLFSFSLNLINIIIMVGVAFNATNSVDIFKTLSSSKEDKLQILKSNTRSIFVIYSVVSLLVLVFGVISVPLVFSKYINAIPYFIILCLYGFLQCVYFLFTNYLFYYKANKKLMFITFGTSCLHLLLSLSLSRYSLYYTCIIYIVSQILLVLLVKKEAYKLLAKNLGVSQIHLILKV